MTDRILRAQSKATDAGAAVAELAAGLLRPDTELVLFFCSVSYDLDALAKSLNEMFAGVPVVGCTTAGEIGPEGYLDGSLCGVSFPADGWTMASARIDDLHAFVESDGQGLAAGLMATLDACRVDPRPSQRFALCLVDGLSMREEVAARAFQEGLRSVPLVGGSAADGMNFCCTRVFHDGAFHSDAAVLVAAHTCCPFRVFKTQHFVRTGERLVITGADPARRLVTSINGLPAADEYSRLLGVDRASLSATSYSTSPLVVLIDGGDYVRSIRTADSDGNLTFYCAIEEGVVLRAARGVDIVSNLQRSLDGVRREIGEPQIVLAYDCILRKLEATETATMPAVEQILLGANACGFGTYGEQYLGVHVNQTLTGIAIGAPRPGPAFAGVDR